MLIFRASMSFGVLGCCDCVELVLTFTSLGYLAFPGILREAVTSSEEKRLPIFSSSELCS